MTKPIVFDVHVENPQGQPVNDAQVTGSLSMKLMDMGATPLTFTPKGDGDYEALVKDADMSGPWSLVVKASQGRANVEQSFDVTVGD
jgi:nitrogen fixation protein FixH